MVERLNLQPTQQFKDDLIRIIKASLKGESLTVSEVTILFHWARHKDDPMYSFVPKKYRK